jgi:hypothetical protein
MAQAGWIAVAVVRLKMQQELARMAGRIEDGLEEIAQYQDWRCEDPLPGFRDVDAHAISPWHVWIRKRFPLCLRRLSNGLLPAGSSPDRAWCSRH